MADGTKIEWTEATWNPITGCSVVSRAGLTSDSKTGPVWNGQVRFNEEWLTQPLHWKRPRMIFVCAHGDLFHPSVPDAWIDRVFAVMALAPQHTFQVLTKRAARMRDYLREDSDVASRICCIVESWDRPGWHKHFEIESCDGDRGAVGWPRIWPLPNVWLGVSAERQQEGDERVPHLLATPAAVRWVSAEPLLGPIDLTAIKMGASSELGFGFVDALDGGQYSEQPAPPRLPHRPSWVSRLNWVVVGGESGADARPMHPDWARALRDQCEAADVPFFFKQWGSWAPEIDRDCDDPDWRQPYSRYAEPHFQILNLAGGRGFHGERVHVMRRCTKASAGRQLDGTVHSAMPPERAV